MLSLRVEIIVVASGSKYPMNAYYRVPGREPAAGSIGKPFGKFRQDLQVLFGCLLGHQQGPKARRQARHPENRMEIMPPGG